MSLKIEHKSLELVRNAVLKEEVPPISSLVTDAALAALCNNILSLKGPRLVKSRGELLGAQPLDLSLQHPRSSKFNLIGDLRD